MATPVPPPAQPGTPQQPAPPGGPQQPSQQQLTADRLRQIIARVGVLRSQGLTDETSPELANLTKFMAMVQQRQRQAQQMRSAAVNGTPPSTSTPPAPTPAPAPSSTPAPAPAATPVPDATPTNGDATAPTAAPDSPPVVSFTPEQTASLKAQVLAFKLLSRNMPIPPGLQAAVLTPAEALKAARSDGGIESLLQQGAGSAAVNGDAAKDAAKEAAEAAKEAALERERALAAEPPVEEVEDPSSLVYPYNAFVSPRDALLNASNSSSRRTFLIPTLLPPGLDPELIAEERNRIIEARVAQRRAELEALPANLSQDESTLDDSTISLASRKIKALIELKSLNLLDRQKALREDVVRGFNQASALSLPADRNLFRRSKKQTLRDARATDQLEKKQKSERERRAKQKHLDHLKEIVTHGRDLTTAHRAHQAKFARIGKALLKFHVDTEKEEQKRVERVSKERLKALRADDEEGYLKLIDTAKDTRITHLLRQTDAFLDSLAAAVVVQQAEARQDDGSAPLEAMQVDEPSAVDESTFGAAPVFEEEEAAKEKVDYYNVAHRVKETITTQPSILVGGQLKAYQLKGLEWMVSLYNNHVNGILADEMGLGKTIQTISLITFLIEVKKQDGPFLVIVPLSTMPNWILEFEKWAPSVKMVSYKGTPTQRKNSQWEIRQGNFQVLLTTYEYIIKDRPLLAKIKWVHMIIDEGHRMKNAQSKLSVTLTTYYTSRYRLILTGTPLQNNLPELWALLNFVLPKIFGSVKSFDEWFNAPFANTGGQDKIEINEEESLLVIRRLHKVLRPFLLRRLKKDVESDLPDKVERVIKCKMSSLQLKLTTQIKKHGMIFTDMATETAKKPTGIRGLQNQIMQLRKICNHPFCFEQVERSIDPTGGSNATLYRVAGKFEVLDRILPKLFATGHRVLMFFQMTTVMTIFEDYLHFRKIQHLRLDGTTKHEDRSSLLKAFNDPESKIPIFILSTRAGGLGLNLQTADTVIIFDSDWNPHQDLQAQDRAHRIGQKKEVRILRLITERSVEEHVMAGASRKIEMDKKVIQAGRYDNKSTAEERDEFLRALLEAGEEEVDEEDDVDDDEALNEAIARGEEERAIFSQMDKNRRAAEETAWAAAGNTGKIPERLIQESELPEVYRMEHQVEVVGEDEIIAEGARRARTQVTYDDGLSEEQWLQALEEEDDDDGTTKKRKRAAASKSRHDSPASEAGARRRGVVLDSDDEQESKKRKRGLQSQADSMTPSLNGDDDERGGGKRRKTQLTAAQERLKGIFDSCLEAMEDLDNPTMGHQCSGLFNVLPAKRDYPDYYILIKNPISLKEIKKKVNTGGYQTVTQFQSDIHLMLRNAMTFNEETSAVYTDARLLLEVFDKTFKLMTEENDDE
ncbi:ATP-dependent helicase STH1/SNF2 [Pseudohyphozyma bogoriensis]|nr:ATP-dependent helicase STH1/SNF2 [Pseudohyphozyma bogoriensis]